MRDLSLHILDIAQNSITAGASVIEISVVEDIVFNMLKILICDNGCGMSAEIAARVINPPVIPENARSGRGVSLFKAACEATSGVFELSSKPGSGTSVKAVFMTSHPNMLRLGAVNETMRLLIACNPEINFIYHRSKGKAECTLDTRKMRKDLGWGSVPPGYRSVHSWLGEYMTWLDEYLARQDIMFQSP